ncbi:MAG: nuclear transport factor 2 family protein [Lewinellaceae bacterium]|nr:nuclear transport factor 2 family protein [Saprospiraceae bacterium]MCB9333725.1 nuclear transport factor 2 family protein [Lewinellaceae bacterium]
MKNVSSALLLLLLISACQPTTEAPKPVDKAAIEKDAAALMDRFYAAQRGDDPAELALVIAEDVIAYGTDPAEIMVKATMLKTIEQYKQDPVMAELLATLNIEVTKRDMRISDDGNQVVVTDQANVSFSKMPIRGTTIMVKGEGGWKVSYYNAGFLVNNTDLAKVDSCMAATPAPAQ